MFGDCPVSAIAGSKSLAWASLCRIVKEGVALLSANAVGGPFLRGEAVSGVYPRWEEAGLATVWSGLEPDRERMVIGGVTPSCRPALICPLGTRFPTDSLCASITACLAGNMVSPPGCWPTSGNCAGDGAFDFGSVLVSMATVVLFCFTGSTGGVWDARASTELCLCCT